MNSKKMRSAEECITPVGTAPYVVNTRYWRWQRPVTDKDRCHRCGQCALYCPTNSRYDAQTHFDTNLDYCKGCGVCAHECWGDAIEMVEEGVFEEAKA
ncbi:MAG: 4Fe-4S binding protein [Chloroflexota bacterium]